jgi:hypothetical protein
MRVRGAHERTVQLARYVNVGNEAPAAAQQTTVLNAPDRGANALIFYRWPGLVDLTVLRWFSVGTNVV